MMGKMTGTQDGVGKIIEKLLLRLAVKSVGDCSRLPAYVPAYVISAIPVVGLVGIGALSPYTIPPGQYLI